MRNARIVLVSFLLLLAADALFAMQPLDREAIMKMSEEERKAFIQELDEKVLRYSQEREKAWRERQAALENAQEQTRKEEAEFAAGATAVYQMDPLLQKAYSMFRDFEHRDREQVVAAFEEYIRRNPDSVFVPEVYHSMGVMYSGNVNHQKGETVDLQKMRDYYLKAHAGFGGKFSVGAMLVYNKLAFLGGTFQQRLEYYDWLRYLQEKGTVDDLYRVRSIGACMSGFPPRYTPEESAELEKMWNHARTNILPGAIRSIEQQIFRDSFQPSRNAYLDLCILAKLYPETELGRQARHAVEQAHEEMGLYRELFDLRLSDAAETASSTPTTLLQATPNDATKGIAAVELPPEQEITATGEAESLHEATSAARSSRKKGLLSGAIAIALAALAVLLVKSRMHSRRGTPV